MKKIIPAGAAGMFILLSACSVPSYYTEKEKDVPGNIESEWGEKVPLPSFNESSISRAQINEDEEGKPEELEIWYSDEEQDELLSYFQDAGNRHRYEEDYSTRLVYGIYSNDIHIILDYEAGDQMVYGAHDEVLSIGGRPVGRDIQSGPMIYTFQANGGTYAISYSEEARADTDVHREQIKAFLQNNG
ncbi:hypothetical protein [Marinococcus halotolerans]|uniref:hypothetical protein n=1 Tax=Marinococcus halotolerans TaxID=301092 RepID=UPI0003B5266D|nr:hypothetical protein [Marinococcus halotolerans]